MTFPTLDLAKFYFAVCQFKISQSASLNELKLRENLMFDGLLKAFDSNALPHCTTKAGKKKYQCYIQKFYAFYCDKNSINFGGNINRRIL